MKGSGRAARWFLLPWLVGIVLLTVGPMAGSLLLSFTDSQGLSLRKMSWVGTTHYENILAVDHTQDPRAGDPWYYDAMGGRPADEQFYRSLYNSLYYTLLAVPLGLVASLVVALLLNERLPGMSAIRAVVYLPHLLGGVATIVIWSWLFNPRFGWINQGVEGLYAVLDSVWMMLFGGDVTGWKAGPTYVAAGSICWGTPDWLYSPIWCKPALVIMHVWTMGGSMLVFLAALRRVPARFYDAARLDGAGVWQRFRRVTWPQITPAVLFHLVMSLVFLMQAFKESYLLEHSAQRDGLLFYVRNVFRAAFEPPYDIGYASALAWILFVVFCVLLLPLIFSARRWVYEAIDD